MYHTPRNSSVKIVVGGLGGREGPRGGSRRCGQAVVFLLTLPQPRLLYIAAVIYCGCCGDVVGSIVDAIRSFCEERRRPRSPRSRTGPLLRRCPGNLEEVHRRSNGSKQDVYIPICFLLLVWHFGIGATRRPGEPATVRFALRWAIALGGEKPVQSGEKEKGPHERQGSDLRGSKCGGWRNLAQVIDLSRLETFL